MLLLLLLQLHLPRPMASAAVAAARTLCQVVIKSKRSHKIVEFQLE